MTLTPNGLAAVCKTAHSGFDSHRRLYAPTDRAAQFLSTPSASQHKSARGTTLDGERAADKRVAVQTESGQEPVVRLARVNDGPVLDQVSYG